MGNQFFNVSLTNEIYQASKPPVVRALFAMPSGDPRDQLAAQLAQQGYLIDVPIDMWNWDAVTTMSTRQMYGFTWVPSALQPPLNGAVGTGPVPPGSIKVSTNAADYPPFDPPPPLPVQSTNMVGALLYGNIYAYGPGAVVNGKFVVTNGEEVTQDGVQYKAHVSQALMGTTVYFEKVA